MANKLLYFCDKYIPIYPRDRILVARSKDGEKWERHIQPVINVGHKYDYDMAYWPFVWLDNTLWKMIFVGTQSFRSPSRKSSLYYTESKDPFNWTTPTPLIHDGGYHSCPRIYTKNGAKHLLWAYGDVSKTIKTLPLNDLNSKILDITITQKNIIKNITEFSVCENILVGTTGKNDGIFYLASPTYKENNWEIFFDLKVNIPKANIIDNPSLNRLHDKWLLFFRASTRSAWGSKILMITSRDLNSWTQPQEVLNYNGLNRDNLSSMNNSYAYSKLSNYELGGVAYPSFISDEKYLYLYYAGYWGLHLLMPYTYWAWR